MAKRSQGQETDPAVESAALSTEDILGHLVEFVPDKQFFFFALVSRSWKAVWAPRLPRTSYVSPDSSISQLRCSFEGGLPPAATICVSLARFGKLRCLQYARANGCPRHMLVCPAAARGGHLDVLQWARLDGCSWNEQTCGAAAEGGHLGVLQWARQGGCSWDGETFGKAAENGHLDVRQGARSKGCPWNSW
ncbi:unnamed protein product, partial [Scytosiphon promiscuus]